MSADRKQAGRCVWREREGGGGGWWLQSKVELLLCTCCEPFRNQRSCETPKM